MTGLRRDEPGQHVLRDLLDRPGRGRVIRLLIGAVVVGAICWVAGTDAWHSVTIGGALFAAGVVWLAAPTHVSPEWADHPPDGSGARPEVMRLSWTLRPHRGQVKQTAVDRVRRVAVARLGSRRLDLDDPAHEAGIVGIIGESAYRLLRDGGAPTVPLRALEYCIDRVEALSEPPGTAPSDRRPADLLGRRTRHDR